MQYFYKKNILIIGASQGIGKATALLLSQYQCKLWLSARNETALQSLCKQINDAGVSSALYSVCDVSDENSVADTIQKATSEFGAIDIAIINAGINGSEGNHFDSNVFKNIYSVNINGILHSLQYLLPAMQTQGGVIAGVTSLADFRGVPGSGAYTSSKTAASFILEAVRYEVLSENIRILTIKPGFVSTNMTADIKYKMPFIISPEKAATYIVKGIAKEKPIIAFPKIVSIASTIGKIMPLWLFKLLFSKGEYKF
ncbi:MAG: SDR family NAD(P)-dependent oxidoreductase [Ignavibacteria bacterium]|jgi:short-subunit dehydrogenase|nr:SDR family NAD(P)-dependent oxidoreductase [Ignavibacteria bacterium]